MRHSGIPGRRAWATSSLSKAANGSAPSWRSRAARTTGLHPERPYADSTSPTWPSIWSSRPPHPGSLLAGRSTTGSPAVGHALVGTIMATSLLNGRARTLKRLAGHERDIHGHQHVDDHAPRPRRGYLQRPDDPDGEQERGRCRPQRGPAVDPAPLLPGLSQPVRRTDSVATRVARSA